TACCSASPASRARASGASSCCSASCGRCSKRRARMRAARCWAAGRAPSVVSVALVNYNGLAVIGACLDSVRAALALQPHEIIVVDNASSDGSREYLRERRDVRLIESPTNAGFAAANNAAAAQARGDLILLLNCDTVCLTALDPLLETMRDPRCG